MKIVLFVVYVVTAITSFAQLPVAEHASADAGAIKSKNANAAFQLDSVAGYVFGSKLKSDDRYLFNVNETMKEPFLGFKDVSLMYNGDKELYSVRFYINSGNNYELEQNFEKCQKYFEEKYSISFERNKSVYCSDVSIDSEFSNDDVEIRMRYESSFSSFYCEIISRRYFKEWNNAELYSQLGKEERRLREQIAKENGRSIEQQIEHELNFKLDSFGGLIFGATGYCSRVKSGRTGSEILELPEPVGVFTEVVHPEFTYGQELCGFRMEKVFDDTKSMDDASREIVAALMKKYSIGLDWTNKADDCAICRNRPYRFRWVNSWPWRPRDSVAVTLDRSSNTIKIKFSAEWVRDAYEERRNKRYDKIDGVAGYCFGAPNDACEKLTRIHSGYRGQISCPVDQFKSVHLGCLSNEVTMITLSTDVFTNSHELSQFIDRTAAELSKKYDLDRFLAPKKEKGKMKLSHRYFDRIFECKNYSIGIYQDNGVVFLEFFDLKRFWNLGFGRTSRSMGVLSDRLEQLYSSLGRKMKSSRMKSTAMPLSPRRAPSSSSNLKNQHQQDHGVPEGTASLLKLVNILQQEILDLEETIQMHSTRINMLEKLVYAQDVNATAKTIEDQLGLLNGGALRERRLQRKKDAAAAALQREQPPQREADNQQREAERAEQRQQLMAVQEELKRLREAKANAAEKAK